MRKIAAIIYRDIRLRFSSPAEWLFFLILPLAFTVILAGGTGGEADNRVRVAVVDQAGSSLSRQLVAGLEASPAVRAETLPLDQAEAEYNSRRVSSVLVIPAGFDLAHLAQGGLQLELRQQPNNLNSLAAGRGVLAAAERTGSAAQIANLSASEAERIQPFSSGEARTAYFEASLQEARRQLDGAPERMRVTQGATPDAVQYDPRANSSAGQLITWVFVPLIGISGLLAYERSQGTLRRILVSPTRRATYLLGTILGQVLIALAQMLLLVGFGALALGLHWGQSPTALAVMLLAIALAGAALGTMLGAFVKSEGQANGLSILLSMVMALLGGCWYPLELFPPAVQAAVRILPTTWAMQGLLDIAVRQRDLLATLPVVGALLGFAAVFFAVGVARFRYE